MVETIYFPEALEGQDWVTVNFGVDYVTILNITRKIIQKIPTRYYQDFRA